MSPEPVPLFVNPIAGRGQAGRCISQVSALLASLGVSHAVTASDAAGDLENRVLAAASIGVRKILIAGGDGSIHEAVNGILRSGTAVELGVIPIGTGNDFAKACSIPVAWQVAVPRLAERILRNLPARPIDVGRMNDRFFANGAGIGFDAKVTAIARNIRWRLGSLVYLAAVIRGMIDGVTTPEVSIEYAGGRYDGAVTIVNFSNGAWIGGMFHIAPMARNDDGRLDLIIARPVSRLRILTLLPSLIRGSHVDKPEITQARLSRCRVTSSGPVTSHLDGEVQPPQSTFDIELLQGALRLM